MMALWVFMGDLIAFFIIVAPSPRISETMSGLAHTYQLQQTWRRALLALCRYRLFDFSPCVFAKDLSKLTFS